MSFTKPKSRLLKRTAGPTAGHTGATALGQNLGLQLELTVDTPPSCKCLPLEKVGVVFPMQAGSH
jgi:hypothetical protein